MKPKAKLKLAIWKFTSCGGCQLSLLDCEDELLALTEAVQIASFPEVTSAKSSPPYDISFVEGSVSTPEEKDRIQVIRRHSKLLVAIGACATSGGIQALRNFASVREFASYVYPDPEGLSVLETSTPLSDHVKVDFELRGCPISKTQLLELVSALLEERKPNLPTFSVCEQCKQRGVTCLMVSLGVPCLGPITMAGCGALCPAFGRGCFGCYGPKENSNIEPMTLELRRLGLSDLDLVRIFRGINGNAPAFRNASEEVPT